MSKQPNFDQQTENAVKTLKRGGVIAYPTEAVFGFGCDPYNLEAISRILQIKHRAIHKGFILVAANFEQIESLIEPVPPRLMMRIQDSWPGPYTWVFPAKPDVPQWITGYRKSIAIRVSDHPTVQAICEQFGGPITSTSANVEGDPPARDYRTALISFNDEVDFIYNGKVGSQIMPTEIRDAVTGEILRSADATRSTK